MSFTREDSQTYKCFISNGKKSLGKFDAKSMEGIFLGYSLDSKVYRVYNKGKFYHAPYK